MPQLVKKPNLSTLALFNLSAGFLGVQLALSLQTANMSRIFQLLIGGLLVWQIRETFGEIGGP